MPDAAVEFEQSLGHLPRQEWMSEVTDLVENHGSLTRLGQRHTATFVESGPTLLVSFESHQGIHALSPNGHPLGWDMVRRFGWSHLGVISDGDTWFRDPEVFAHFDALVDDGFFDGFDRVLFYGAGPCGYAAAAFSVTAPGATVLAIQPQATLDPQVTEWDKRFVEMRRTSFTDRYGYAPDMLDAATQAFVVFDPSQVEDAMHAALFTRPNVTMLRARHLGGALQTDFLQMKVLSKLISAAGRDSLTQLAFAELLRARRDHLPYLRRLLSRLDHDERARLIEMLCRSVVQRHKAPRFARRLEQFSKAAGA